MRRAKRVECEGVMLSVAGTLERSMSANGKYPPATGQGAITLPSCPKDGGTTNYTLAYTSNDQTYTLTATPVGMQVQDTKCGVLTLNHAGQKGAKGTVPNPDCWR
ncbi:MAG: type IV pilin protein [Zoogloeaceae bacterium]|nr:type IV pilin protein [Zoogloeaceae bacterium]